MTKKYTKEEFNLYLLERLLFLSELQPTLNTSSKKKFKKKEKFFENPKVKTLDYSKSSNFLSIRFQDTIETILPSPLDFHAKTLKQKQKIQSELMKLCKAEYEWKNYTKRVSLNTDNVQHDLKPYFENFSKELNTYLFPTDEDVQETQRAEKNYFLFKFQTSLKYLFSKMIECGKINSLTILNELTDDDYKKIVENHIDTHDIFDDLLRIAIKKAHHNLYSTSNENQSYTNDALVTHSHELYYESASVLLLSFINSILLYVNRTKNANLKIINLSLSIQNYVYKSKYDYESSKNFLKHFDNVRTILDMFQRSGMFQVVDEKNKHKTYKKIILPQTLQVMRYNPLKIAYITEPPVITVDTIDKKIKPVLFGRGDVTKSQKLALSLNISQQKKFAISESFLSILGLFSDVKYDIGTSYEERVDSYDTHAKIIDGMNLHDMDIYLKKYPLDLGFPTKFDIAREKKELRKLDIKLSPYHEAYVFKSVKSELISNFNIDIQNNRNLSKLLSINNTKQYFYWKHRNVRKRVESLILHNKMFETTIAMANIFKGYPIYITDILCLRLRMYPYEHWVSRTSGVLKPLLRDYDSEKITLPGLIHLMKAYYAHNNELFDRFTLYITDKEVDSKLLFDFLKKNPADLVSAKNTLYIMHLHLELLKIEKCMETSVAIEIDQTASGVVFLSFILRDKKMALASNLLTKERRCPYTYVMNEFQGFADIHMENKNNKAFDFIKTSRKLHKYALMCFSYNQKDYGRMENFKELWNNTYNSDPKIEEYSTLKEFSKKYELFIEYVFPNSTKKLKILNEAMLFVARESSKTTISTLEGDIINWTFHNVTRIPSSRFDPVIKKHISYHINIENDKSVDYKAHKVKFLSYLIHSIDAAVLRFFIREMYVRYNYRINHVHDCIILHPNYVEQFYGLVNELYKTNEMYHMVETLVFNQFKQVVSVSSKLEIDKYEKQYLDLCDDFKDCMNFDPKNIYKYEV